MIKLLSSLVDFVDDDNSDLSSLVAQASQDYDDFDQSSQHDFTMTMQTCLLWLPKPPLAALQSNLSQQAARQCADRHHYHQRCFLYFNADDDDHCQNCP